MRKQCWREHRDRITTATATATMIALYVLPVLFCIASCNANTDTPPEVATDVMESDVTDDDVTKVDATKATLVDTKAEYNVVMNNTTLFSNGTESKTWRRRKGRGNHRKRKRKGQNHRKRKRKGQKHRRRHKNGKRQRRIQKDNKGNLLKKENEKIHGIKEPRMLYSRGRSQLKEKLCRTWKTRMKVTFNVTERSITVDYCSGTKRYHPETLTCIVNVSEVAQCQLVSPPICSHTFRNLGKYSYTAKLQAQCDCFSKEVLGSQNCHDTWFTAADSVDFSLSQTPDGKPSQEQKEDDNLVIEVVVPIVFGSILSIGTIIVICYWKMRKRVRPPEIDPPMTMVTLTPGNISRTESPPPDDESIDDSRRHTLRGSWWTVDSSTDVKEPVSSYLQQVDNNSEELRYPTLEHQIQRSAECGDTNPHEGELHIRPPIRTRRNFNAAPIICSNDRPDVSWEPTDESSTAEHYFKHCGSPGILGPLPDQPRNPLLQDRDNLPIIPLPLDLLCESETPV